MLAARRDCPDAAQERAGRARARRAARADRDRGLAASAAQATSVATAPSAHASSSAAPKVHKGIPSRCKTTVKPKGVVKFSDWQFPANLTAKMFSFKDYPFFEAPPAATQVPKVNFSKS